MIKTVSADGVEFGYLEAGSGPLVLCLHGFPDSAHTWRHLLPVLADAGFHAVAPFMRGYAPTAVPDDGAYQTGALAADANALHEALGGDGDAILVGHDWGGFATYGAINHQPDRWRRAVTMAVPPRAVFATAFLDYAQLKRSFYVFLFQAPLAEAAVMADDMTFLDALWRDWSPGYDAAQDLAHVKDSLRDSANLTAALGYYRALYDTSRQVETYAAVQQAAEQVGTQQVLYLHGTADGCVGADVVEDAARHLPPGSRMEMIEGAGHFLQLEQPAEVNQRVLDWLTG